MYNAMYNRGVRMIRKQVYIEPEQERRLKRRARELGVTEAELIRRGVDAVVLPSSPRYGRDEAIRRIKAMLAERAKIRAPQTGRNWTREELYEARLARFSR